MYPILLADSPPSPPLLEITPGGLFRPKLVKQLTQNVCLDDILLVSKVFTHGVNRYRIFEFGDME